MKLPLCSLRAVALGSFGLLLGGCTERPGTPPVPVVQAAQPASSASVGAGSDASVPTAASVMAPAAQASVPDTLAGRATKAMSRAEESTAMPMPGQNNDHSAPLPPARRAGSPASTP